MLKSKKGAANVTLIALIVVAVVLAAALITTAVVLSNANDATEAKLADLSEKVDAQKYVTEAEVEALIADIDIPEGVDKDYVAKEITAAINSYKTRDISAYVIQLMIDKSIAAIQMPEATAGLTEDQVKALIDAAIAEIEIPEATTAGLTEAQVKAIVDTAIKALPAGLTEAQVKAIVDNAVAALKNELSATAVTKAQMEQAIADALKNVTPGTGLSYYEVQALIDAAIAALKNEQPQQPTTPADLKSALQAGGTYAAAGNVTLSDVNIPQNVTSVLDLKGYTLTVRDEDVDDSISVLGSLTVTNGTIVIERPTAAEAIYQYAGLCVEAGGALNFDNVTIIGDRLWNVANSGTLQLTNSKFTVESGYGIKNYGAAVVKNCTMVANGEATSQIYSTGGTVDVTGTSFVEGADFESYYYAAPIESHYASVVTLEGVNITTTGTDEYSVWAGNGGKVVIKSGTINSKPACVNDSTVTIYGGTINGVAYSDITAASDIFAGAGCKLTQGTNCWIISK